MAQYTDLIPENTAILGTRRIGIYNLRGDRVGFIPLGNLGLKNVGKKKYSFGALSDVHIVYDTATSDFQAALTYLNESEDVEFTCICGDLTDDGTSTQLAQYKALVDAYSPDTPVYAIAGNHESYNSEPVTTDKIQPYTGQPFYYSFTQGSDVFIMVGCYSAHDGIFTTEEIQWLYETLEANRNKRCFVFQHVFPWDDSGNANNAYAYGNLFSGTLPTVFQSLMVHYKNVIFFHGHSHMKFYLQELDDKANYYDGLGYRSVHIPSLAVPRDIIDTSLTDIYADSEGYVVDVYQNGIHLRGRDFVRGEFIPIASYWLDTTLVTIEAGTYTDSTGTITK